MKKEKIICNTWENTVVLTRKEAAELTKHLQEYLEFYLFDDLKGLQEIRVSQDDDGRYINVYVKGIE